MKTPFGHAEIRRVGREVRRLREKAPMTQVQLGEAACISASAVRDLENGRSNPTLSTFVAIVDALGVSIDVLVQAARQPQCVFQVTRADPSGAAPEQMLSRALADLEMDASIMSLERGMQKDFSGDAVFAFVLDGAVRAAIGDHSYDLAVGDSLHVQAHTPGDFSSSGGRLLVVNARPAIDAANN